VACLCLGRALQSAGRIETALQELEEAQHRFEEIESRNPGGGSARMAAEALHHQGDCLGKLGRLDEAERAFNRAIALARAYQDKRLVAVSIGKLGIVLAQQARLPEALAAFSEARDSFAALDDRRSVGALWRQIGMAQQDAGNGEEAEDAYRQSLEIAAQLNDVTGQVDTLVQLGNLYFAVLRRPEDAVTPYRQAAERCVALHDVRREGLVRNNLALTLRLLGRSADARFEIERAIECIGDAGRAVEPWRTWGILADIESDDGRETEARRAYTQAREAYLAYRRDGGESRTTGARLAAEIGRLLAAGDATAANALLQQAPPDWFPPLVAGLRALVDGQREPSIADAPGLNYDDAAELLLLLESLKAAGH
jgi:tetratricopeptide (TPR) repeat protein